VDRSRRAVGRPSIGQRVRNARVVAGLPASISSHGGADVVRLDIGPFPVAQVREVELARRVLDEREAGIAERGRFYDDIARVIGRSSLVTCGGPQHRRLRRALAPAFRPDQVASYASTMVAAAERLGGSWHDGQAVDLGAAFTGLTLEIAARALFGFERADQVNDFVTVLGEGTRVFYRLLLPRRLSDALWRNRWSPANRRLFAAQSRIDALVRHIIDERRDDPDRDRVHPGTRRAPNLLDVLLATTDEQGAGLSPEEIRDQVVTFLFAGHETTAQALTWLFVQLALEPDVVARLEEELARVIGGRRPGVEDLPELVYLKAVVRETLRLYPPAWFLSRSALGELDLGGCPVPRETLVVVSPYALHRDERYWPDPLRFDPDRFLTPVPTLPSAYLPFGHGRRNCIGSNFALNELVLVLATIARQWRVEVIEAGRVRPRASVTLRPRRTVRAVVHRRAAS
jgi:pentalenene oxygenase